MSQTWPRLVLAILGAAVFAFAQEMETWLFQQKNPALGIGVVLASAISLSYLILAARDNAPKWANTFVLATSLLFITYYSMIQVLVVPYLADTPAVSHYAAELLLQGKNPYASFDMQDALDRFGMGPEYATLLEDGSMENRLNYPAGSFLFLAPFLAIGLSDTRIVYILCLVVMTLILHYSAHPLMKNVVILFLVANLALLRYTFGGLPEPLWALPTLVAWLTARHRWSSPLAMGIATAIKQLSWFFVPFYLVMAFHEFGFKEAARRAAVVLSVFVAINLPFVVLSPIAWLNGIAGPMLDPLVPMGGGLVALSTTGVLPALSKPAYTLLEITIMIVSLAWYFKYYPRYKPAGVILSTLPLWFAWRSLLSYFYMGSFLLLGTIISTKHDLPIEEKALEGSSVWEEQALRSSG